MGANLNLNPKITLKHRKQNPKESLFSFHQPSLTARQPHCLTAPTKRTHLRCTRFGHHAALAPGTRVCSTLNASDDDDHRRRSCRRSCHLSSLTFAFANLDSHDLDCRRDAITACWEHCRRRQSLKHKLDSCTGLCPKPQIAGESLYPFLCFTVLRWV